jgi:hypothetical protein
MIFCRTASAASDAVANAGLKPDRFMLDSC